MSRKSKPQNVAKKIYNKPAKSCEELALILQGENLHVPNQQELDHHLKYTGYYRLKPHMRAFEDSSNQLAPKNFKAGTSITDIVALYNADSVLRHIVVNGVEWIEVALRAQTILTLTGISGSHGYLSEDHYDRKSGPYELIPQINKMTGQASKHYRENYQEPYVPPIWIALENSTFGTLSKLYSALAAVHKKAISSAFGIDAMICESWVRSLVTTRNIAAHHGHIWNANYNVDSPAKLNQNAARLLGTVFPNFNWPNQNSIYSRLYVMRVFLSRICPQEARFWVGNLRALLLGEAKPSSMDLQKMGFPMDWHNISEWLDT